MQTLRASAGTCCEEHAGQIKALEHRIAELEKFFAILQGARPTAIQKAADRWHPAAS